MDGLSLDCCRAPVLVDIRGHTMRSRGHIIPGGHKRRCQTAVEPAGRPRIDSHRLLKKQDLNLSGFTMPQYGAWSYVYKNSQILK